MKDAVLSLRLVQIGPSRAGWEADLNRRRWRCGACANQLGEPDWRWEEGRLLAPQSLEVSSRRKPGKRPTPKSK